MIRTQSTLTVIVTAMIFAMSALITVPLARAAPLEPPDSAVDPAGNPVPTGTTPPSWDKTLPPAERFVPVMNGEAVLDKETGLVWERSPASTSYTWRGALTACILRVVAGRTGWRLPSVHELATLATLLYVGSPPGQPFVAVHGFYWSATSRTDNPDRAWILRLRPISAGNGLLGNSLDGEIIGGGSKSGGGQAWCVRSGGPLSEY